jgi:hypothetical protein
MSPFFIDDINGNVTLFIDEKRGDISIDIIYKEV